VCRNQWWNPLKKSGPAVKSGGWPGLQCAEPPYNREGRPRRPQLLLPGATMKVCGVVVDRPAGEKLGTHPVDRSAVNVGTVPGSPNRRPGLSSAARHAVC
jgi:hypothetical protein